MLSYYTRHCINPKHITEMLVWGECHTCETKLPNEEVHDHDPDKCTIENGCNEVKPC